MNPHRCTREEIVEGRGQWRRTPRGRVWEADPVRCRGSVRTEHVGTRDGFTARAGRCDYCGTQYLGYARQDGRGWDRWIRGDALHEPLNTVGATETEVGW